MSMLAFRAAATPLLAAADELLTSSVPHMLLRHVTSTWDLKLCRNPSGEQRQARPISRKGLHRKASAEGSPPKNGDAATRGLARIITAGSFAAAVVSILAS